MGEVIKLDGPEPSIQVHFYGDVFGDEVDLESNAANERDILVRPNDPGGLPRVRLFRISEVGLEARKVDDVYPLNSLIGEVLKLAARGQQDGPMRPPAGGPASVTTSLSISAAVVTAARVSSVGRILPRMPSDTRRSRDDPSV
jgi:hypothetical protein